jgi:hypothetical protein
VTYKWLYEDETSVPHPGFIAQEVEEVLPLLVDTNDSQELKDQKAIRTTGMIPYLVKAIQEQQATIEALSETVHNLQTIVNSMQAAT